MTKRNTALDGLRFLAIFLVVASHCQFLFQGGVGNCIFFAMSGFLACAPFKPHAEEAFAHPKYWVEYYINRILRIVPIYWASILSVYLFIPNNYYIARDFTSFDSLLLNLLFIKCKGIFWFIQQEMFFYLIFPAMMLIIFAFKKLVSLATKKEAVIDGMIIVFLILCTFLADRHVNILLYGNGGKISFRLEQFLIGMIFAYVYKLLSLDLFKHLWNKAFACLADVYLFGFILFCILSSKTILGKINYDYSEFVIGWEHPYLCGALAGTALVFICLFPTCFMCKVIGNKVFSYIGERSFIIYLLHLFLISFLMRPSVIRTTFSVMVVSTALASILHEWVEAPSIKLSKKIKEVHR